MTVNLSTLTETIENLKTLRKTLMEQSQEGLKLAFKSFLETYPQVKTITWAQYTPYFNDGDECTFTIGEVYFSPMDAADIEGYYDAEEGYFYTTARYEYANAPNPNFDPTKPEDSWRNRRVVNRRVEGSEKYDPRTTPQMREDINALSSLMNSDEMEDALRQAFDNHVWIKAYLKDGKVEFDVEEYSHD